MSISEKDRKILWGRSGNRCALCRRLLVAERTSTDLEAVVGDEAHIAARSQGGPRHGQCAPEVVNSYENLILLCKVDHKKVDDQPLHYTTAGLRQAKTEHEAWVEQTLTDTPRPIRFQFDSAAPARQLASKPRRGLPRRRSLVGRDAEIERGKTILTQGERPVLLVHGPPGVGKTALAEHLAWLMQDAFADRVVIDVPDQGDLLALVLLALDPSGQVPGDRHQQLARVSALLGGPRVLMVLDNVRTEESLADLLTIDGTFAVVCTSRSRLTGLAFEGVAAVEVAPLSQEDAAYLAKSNADRLTAEESVTLATVCGGLPIAVLIASARIQKRAQLSVPDYLTELADPDHGTEELRAGEKSVERIIESSFRLLDDNQARLLTALGLLPNATVSVDVVAAACSNTITDLADGDLRSTSRWLDDLVELHLIEQVDEETFRLHAVLYRFARHKATTMEQAWRDRVVAHGCLAYAVRIDLAVRSIGYADADARIPSENNTKALAILEKDHIGAVTMAERAAERELWEAFKRLTRALTPALQHLGRWSELARISTCLKDAGEQTGNADWHATGLLNLGTAAARKGETEDAITLFRKSFEVAEDADHGLIAESASTAYGNLLLDMGHAAEAIPVLRRSLCVWRILDHELMLAQALNSMGKANLAMARWGRAEEYFRNALRVARRARIGGLLGPFGVVLAQVLRLRGRCVQAKVECEGALERARVVGNREVEADALQELALIDSALGDDESLLDTLTLALDIYREIGDVRSQVSTLLLMGNTAEDRGDRAQAMEHFSDCARMADAVNDLRHVANAYAHIANLLAEAGEHDEADEYLRCATEAAEQSGSDLLMLQVQHQQANILRRVGKIDQVVPVLRRNVRLLESTGESDALASARARLGEALMQLGDWREAALILRSVAEAPTDTASSQVRASAFRFLATLYSRRELWQEASHTAEQALLLAEKSGSRSERMHCHHTRGNVLARRSEWSNAAAEYEQAAGLAVELHDFQTMLIIRSNQASCEKAIGDEIKAIATIREILPVAETLGLDDLHASLRINLGACLADQQDLAAARQEFERAYQIATSLGNNDLIETAAESLAKVHVSMADPKAALQWIHEVRRRRQKVGDLTVAADALERELLIRMAIAAKSGEDPDQISVPHDVSNPLLNTLRARRKSFPLTANPSVTDQLSDRRTIVVAQEIINKLADIKINAICARLATGRRHCAACGLPILEEGVANLVLLQFQDGAPAVTLAHPNCMPSSVVEAKGDPGINAVRFEIECYIWGEDLPGIIVDVRGPWSADDDGEPVDIFLASLHKAGFVNISNLTKTSPGVSVPELAKESAHANLTGSSLEIVQGEEVIAPNLPLSFYPRWYRGTQGGTLLVIFGHDLRGMAADDPSYLIKASNEGNLIGAAIELNVTAPARNRPCICTPRTNLKFKHCCGRRKT